MCVYVSSRVQWSVTWRDHIQIWPFTSCFYLNALKRTVKINKAIDNSVFFFFFKQNL